MDFFAISSPESSLEWDPRIALSNAKYFTFERIQQQNYVKQRYFRFVATLINELVFTFLAIERGDSTEKNEKVSFSYAKECSRNNLRVNNAFIVYVGYRGEGWQLKVWLHLCSILSTCSGL